MRSLNVDRIGLSEPEPHAAPVPLGRWALVTDRAFDDTAAERVREWRRAGLVGVIVDPRCFEGWRARLPGAVRCATHPDELGTLSLGTWLVWQGAGVDARHGRRLRAMAPVVAADDGPGVATALPIACSTGTDGC